MLENPGLVCLPERATGLYSGEAAIRIIRLMLSAFTAWTTRHPWHWLLPLALLGSCHLSAQDASASEAQDSSCEVLYAEDAPELYDFVDTRAKVNFEPFEGLAILDIHYRILPIFNTDDPDEDNPLYRTANWLHIDTRPKTLRKQMVIKPGEALSVEKVRENERILRANDYLVDAMILPHRLCAGGIELLVVVRDIWTFAPEVKASRSGGENSTGAGISESNLFGSGQKVTLGYYQDADRSGTIFRYHNPNMLRHVNFSTTFLDNSDGEELGYSLEKPFYELDGTWAAGTNGNIRSAIESIDLNDVEVNRYALDSTDRTVFGGWSTGRQGIHVNRWLLGFTETTDEFSALPETTFLPDEEILRYPWLGWSYSQDRFQTAENINRSHRQEDIQLGYRQYLQLGYASTSMGSTDNRWVFDLGASYTSWLRRKHLITTSAYANGQRDDVSVINTFYGTALDYIYSINQQNRWYFRASVEGGRNIRQDEQLTTGGLENLRGYPNEYQRGNRRWLLSAERRRFTDIHIFNLMYLGFGGYVDAGRTWDTETPGAEGTQTLADVGLGIRLSPSKFRINNVIHIDLAAPLVNTNEVDSYQLIITGSAEF